MTLRSDRLLSALLLLLQVGAACGQIDSLKALIAKEKEGLPRARLELRLARQLLTRDTRDAREHIRSALATAEQAAQDLQDADLELRKVEPAVRSPASQMLATMTSRVNEMLTRREVEVLRLMADGRTNQQIADELIISPGTVKSHVKRVLRKLHATNRAEAASIYARLGNATTAL